jgi:hypothetical protein
MEVETDEGGREEGEKTSTHYYNVVSSGLGRMALILEFCDRHLSELISDDRKGD